MDYCWQGWILVLISTVSFAIGGLIATYGWNIWSHQSDEKKYLRKGAWDIIRGTVVIALAGLLTTHGWNIIKLGEQRNNLIRAIAHELLMNILSLESPPIKGETYYRKKNGDVVTRPFPILRTTALDAVMSSGLWDLGNQTEENFLGTIFDYGVRIRTANSVFGAYNNAVDNIIDPNKKIAETEECQKIAPEKDYFKSLEGAQNQLIELLLSEYKGVIPSKLGEYLQQKIPEKPSANKLEDVNKPKEALPKN